MTAPSSPNYRTFQPVHRRSRIAGDRWEREFILPHDHGALSEMRRGVRRLAEKGRKGAAKWKRNDQLPEASADVYDYLASLCGKHRGRIAVALDTIASATGWSLTAVKAALAAMAGHQLLEWARRLVPSDEAGPVRGVQVKQTCNLYRLLPLPKRVRALLGVFCRPPPPDCESARKAAMLAEMKAYEVAEAKAAIDAAAEAGLARAAAANRRPPPLREREDASRLQSPPLFSQEGE